jgi:hypothetical protein
VTGQALVELTRFVAVTMKQFKMRCVMKLEGVVQNGVIIPDDARALAEGMRVRIEPVQVGNETTFGHLFGDLVIDCPDLPTDLAAQHDHYRLGKPKR